MRWTRIFIPRIEYVFLAAVFWGISANGPKILNQDGDLPRHLLVGQLTLQTEEIATVDIFSFRTEGYHSYPHEWLAQVTLAIPYQVFGLDGVVLLVAVIITFTFAIVFRTARKMSTPLIALIFTTLALSASTIHILPRPHIFTFLFTSVWHFLMERVHKGQSKSWWLFPVLMLVWVNIHGMFLLGLLIWIAYMFGCIFDRGLQNWWRSQESRLLLSGGLASIPVTFLSPSGPGIWIAILELGSNSYITSRIPEYRPANFHLPGTWPFILMLVLLITGFALNTKKLNWSSIFLSAGFTALALYSSRMIPIFGIVIAPIVSQAFANWLHTTHPESALANWEAFSQNMESRASGLIWVFITALIVFGLFSANIPINSQHKNNVFDPDIFPVDAIEWLQNHPQEGHMFNEFNWGGYILLNTWPEYQIFMDGHTHIYGEMLTREYEQTITLSQGWESVLNAYQIEWAILPTSSILANELSEHGWKILYADRTATVLRDSTTP